MADAASMRTGTTPVVAGIDGCSGGWLYVSRQLDTDRFEACILSTIAEIAVLTPGPKIAMIDIPIGLAGSGPRQCDLDARKLLGRPRSSSVFPAPIRPCLAAASYEDACAISMRIDGKRLSRQSWGILGKVREVDAFLRANPDWQPRIRETHPELGFFCWNSHVSLADGKNSVRGFAERRRMVLACFGNAYLRCSADLPGDRFSGDDLLDAFAALWSAQRVALGNALIIPAVPRVDEFGFSMEILA